MKCKKCEEHIIFPGISNVPSGCDLCCCFVTAGHTLWDKLCVECSEKNMVCKICGDMLDDKSTEKKCNLSS